MRTDDQEPIGQRMVRWCEWQSIACAFLGSPFYAHILELAAVDAAEGGPVAATVSEHGHLDDGSAVPLRLLGRIHRLALTGDVPDVAAHFPDVGGDGDPEAAWIAIRALLEHQPELVRPGLDSPPQTNEVGRSTALLGGLLQVVDRFGLPIRLHELGSSAGLNLRPDRFAYRSEIGDWGADDAPVTFSDCWTGEPLPLGASLRIVERGGCDLAPVDLSTPEGVLTLRSYVWADDAMRLARLDGAVAAARAEPVAVQACPASTYLQGLDRQEGTALVVWHSVVRQYFDAAEDAAVEAELARLGAGATDDVPVVHLSYEREDDDYGTPVIGLRMQTWPGSSPDAGLELLAVGQGHGPPIQWAP
jgi:hypothetical protein